MDASRPCERVPLGLDHHPSFLAIICSSIFTVGSLSKHMDCQRGIPCVRGLVLLLACFLPCALMMIFDADSLLDDHSSVSSIEMKNYIRMLIVRTRLVEDSGSLTSLAYSNVDEEGTHRRVGQWSTHCGHVLLGDVVVSHSGLGWAELEGVVGGVIISGELMELRGVLGSEIGQSRVTRTSHHLEICELRVGDVHIGGMIQRLDRSLREKGVHYPWDMGDLGIYGYEDEETLVVRVKLYGNTVEAGRARLGNLPLVISIMSSLPREDMVNEVDKRVHTSVTAYIVDSEEGVPGVVESVRRGCGSWGSGRWMWYRVGERGVRVSVLRWECDENKTGYLGTSSYRVASVIRGNRVKRGNMAHEERLTERITDRMSVNAVEVGSERTSIDKMGGGDRVCGLGTGDHSRQLGSGVLSLNEWCIGGDTSLVTGTLSIHVVVVEYLGLLCVRHLGIGEK
ncbi:hypothetical protein Tco_1427864 [Tanacetum coccineum]